LRRLVVHIGYPKTGTSALQSFFYAHRRQLEECGILYPREADLIGSQHSLAFDVGPGAREAPNGLTFEKLGRQVRESDAEVFVISSEQWVVHADQVEAAARVERFAEEAELEVDVLAFIRPQHSYINSFYGELIKRFHERRRFQSYAEEAIHRPLLDYSKHLGEWDRGQRMRLVPVPFTSDRLQPSLEAAFFEAAGITELAGELLEHAGRRVNPSPGPLSVEVCRRVAAHLHQRHRAVTDNRARIRLSRSVLRLTAQKMSWERGSFNGLDDELREQLDAHVADSNRAFADRYWSADWHDVFARAYEPGVVSNEFGRSMTTMRDRRAVDGATRTAINRADLLLGAPGRRRAAGRGRARSAAR
jgi:hypothetical protein